MTYAISDRAHQAGDVRLPGCLRCVLQLLGDFPIDRTLLGAGDRLVERFLGRFKLARLRDIAVDAIDFVIEAIRLLLELLGVDGSL